ncbi:MAG TPA: hypothetical protein VMR51_01250 [Patescibacteria group bacterium]|nr:hypothetical protein [Patescibacteria group bacterium]
MERPVLEAQHIPHIRNAFADIAQVEVPIGPLRITSIYRNAINGRIITEDLPDQKPLTAEQILRILREAPDFEAISKEETLQNMQLVAKLGAFALEIIDDEEKPHSKAKLQNLQGAIHNIRRKETLALPGSTIDGDLYKQIIEALVYINSVIHPNFRSNLINIPRERYER